MKKGEGVIIFILLFAALIVGAYLFYTSLSKTAADSETSNPEETEAVASEEPEADKVSAENFTVYDVDGNEVSLSDFAGKPVVLNFWASWCSFCKLEMPDFNDVWADYGEDVEFLMVNVTDGSREKIEDGMAYIDENGYSFPVYYDTDMDATYAYKITSLPTTVFIDADGYVVNTVLGAQSKDTLLNNIGLITGG
ncbi:MAG: TlpA family protein disulfide reductase [Clostridia bacterium]|nr:TlpA family protein disulfide reductase [Clostridia bacterium]NCC69247.1 TlpA family protein disulfide reductase [Clostridia bacterium]